MITSGPSVERPIFLDVYEKKISDNDSLWNDFNHVPIEQELLVTFVSDFFGRLLANDYEGLIVHFKSNKGFFMGEIEAEYLGKDYKYYTFNQIEESLHREDSNLYEYLKNVRSQLDSHLNDWFNIVQNAFYSEDINMVYKTFGNDVYLIECISSSSNYMSFIVTKEVNDLKICYLNVSLDTE